VRSAGVIKQCTSIGTEITTAEGGGVARKSISSDLDSLRVITTRRFLPAGNQLGPEFALATPATEAVLVARNRDRIRTLYLYRWPFVSIGK